MSLTRAAYTMGNRYARRKDGKLGASEGENGDHENYHLPAGPTRKGKIVRVLGRVRVQRYTDETGADRSCWEVLAHKLEIMED